MSFSCQPKPPGRDLYVCGVIFNRERTAVLLIEKQYPAFMAGQLNGVGGRVGPDESPLAAMQRTAAKETGLTGLEWAAVATLTGEDHHVWFFTAESADIWTAANGGPEAVFQYNVADLRNTPQPVFDNLHVVIALAADDCNIVKPVALVEHGRNFIKHNATVI